MNHSLVGKRTVIHTLLLYGSGGTYPSTRAIEGERLSLCPAHGLHPIGKSKLVLTYRTPRYQFIILSLGQSGGLVGSKCRCEYRT